MMLDVTDLPAVIVGGGAVAVRKARGLIAAGARCVRCVAPSFHAELPPGVQRVAESFESRHLDGARLVFAATDDPAVNEQVVREAHARGLLVNRADADDQEPGDFSTPALWREGAVTVSVSTAGSPALAAAIRDDLARRIEPLHLRMAEAMQTLRPLLRDSTGLPPRRRREVFQSLAAPESLRALGDGGIEGLKRWLAQRYPELGTVLTSQTDAPGE